MSDYSIGIDLGGTKICIGLIDNKGNVLQTTQLMTDIKGGSLAIEQQIIKAVNELSKIHQNIRGIGIGIAGQVDPLGIVSFAPNLAWHNIPLKNNLEKVFERPIIVINDVQAAAFAEWKTGAGMNHHSLVCIFVGTGIGSGIVIDNQLISGSSGCFGEIGHMIIDWKGPPCSCGSRGCLESLAGGWAIAQIAQREANERPEQWKQLIELLQGKISLINAKNVCHAVTLGDIGAITLMKNVESALIAGAVSIANAFNPEMIIFGGGIIQGSPHFIQSIEHGIKELALPAVKKNLKIAAAQFKNEAGMIGAGLIALKSD